MNTAFLFARKYYHSGKVRNVINWISRISQLGITVGTMALIIVLSVFNGFEKVVIGLYNSFDPDLKITTIEGKFFQLDQNQIDEIASLKGVLKLSEVIEENALVKFKEQQSIATFKGMSDDYFRLSGLDSMIILGDALLHEDGINYALLGSGVAAKLGMNYFDFYNNLSVYYPNKGSPQSFHLNPGRMFNIKMIAQSGIFQIQQDFDEKYILVPLEFVRELVKENERYTAIEILTREGSDLKKLKKEIQHISGDDFMVRTHFELHDWLYKIMKSEKLVVYLILSFILLIAAFNLVGSLLMLAIEKKRDMMVLRSMGASNKLIRNIFFYEGLFLSVSSAIVGIIAGSLLSFLQLQFGIIKISHGSTFIIDAFPVAFKAMDFLWVFITVVILGFVSAYFPSRIAYRQLSISDLHSK